MDAQTSDIIWLWAEHSLQATAFGHQAHMRLRSLTGHRQDRAHFYWSVQQACLCGELTRESPVQ
jgi:hypothetical protein